MVNRGQKSDWSQYSGETCFCGFFSFSFSILITFIYRNEYPWQPKKQPGPVLRWDPFLWGFCFFSFLLFYFYVQEWKLWWPMSTMMAIRGQKVTRHIYWAKIVRLITHEQTIGFSYLFLNFTCIDVFYQLVKTDLQKYLQSHFPNSVPQKKILCTVRLITQSTFVNTLASLYY